MPLTADIKMVSIDDHLVEPVDVWTSRLPHKFRDVGPHVIEIQEETLLEVGAGMRFTLCKGQNVWCYEGRITPTLGLSAIAGTEFKKRNLDPVRFDQMRRGAWDPRARLDDMDTDGVWVQAPFPSYPGFAGNKFVDAKDKDLARLCVEAYNDFLLDEWCATAPDRYIPIVLLPLWDIPASQEEVRRTAGKGARGISFPDSPSALGLPAFHTEEWDPVFAAAAEADMPLCMHFGGSRVLPYSSVGAHPAVITTLFGVTLFNSMTELVLSSAFHNHPTLKVAYSEGGIGWFPYAMMRIDQVWEHYRYYDLEPRINAHVRPTDLIREHVWACFIDDPVGLRERHVLGVDHLLWEEDYPHVDSLWPNSRTNAEKVFADIPTDEVRKIVCDNARALFKFSDS